MFFRFPSKGVGAAIGGPRSSLTVVAIVVVELCLGACWTFVVPACADVPGVDWVLVITGALDAACACLSRLVNVPLIGSSFFGFLSWSSSGSKSNSMSSASVCGRGCATAAGVLAAVLAVDVFLDSDRVILCLSCLLLFASSTGYELIRSNGFDFCE